MWWRCLTGTPTPTRVDRVLIVLYRVVLGTEEVCHHPDQRPSPCAGVLSCRRWDVSVATDLDFTPARITASEVDTALTHCWSTLRLLRAAGADVVGTLAYVDYLLDLKHPASR